MSKDGHGRQLCLDRLGTGLEPGLCHARHRPELVEGRVTLAIAGLPSDLAAHYGRAWAAAGDDDFDDAVTAASVEHIVADLERAIRQRYPDIRQFFLAPASADAATTT